MFDLSAVDVDVIAGDDVRVSIRTLCDAGSVVGGIDECCRILGVGTI